MNKKSRTNEVSQKKPDVSIESMSDELLLEIIEDALRKKYLLRLNELEVVPATEFPDMKAYLADNVCLYHLAQVSYQENDPMIEKLTTVYGTLGTFKHSVFAVIDSDGTKTDYYFGIRNNDQAFDEPQYTAVIGDTFKRTLESNFPGTRTELCSPGKVREISDKILTASTVSSVSAKGNFRSVKKDGYFTQGPEVLVRAMQGKKYTGLIIAEDLPADTMRAVMSDLQDIYSKLSPYKNTHFSGTLSGESSGSRSFSDMSNKEKASTIGEKVVTIAGMVVCVAKMGIKGVMVGSSFTSKITGFINSLLSKSEEKKGSTSNGYMYENKQVSDLLTVVDDTLKRFAEYEKYGMWNTAAYFVSDEPYSAEMTAAIYRALMLGEGTVHEPSVINTWKKSEDTDNIQEIRKSLSMFSHPKFIYSESKPVDQDGQGEQDETIEVYVDASAGVSGRELALHIGLPRE